MLKISKVATFSFVQRQVWHLRGRRPCVDNSLLHKVESDHACYNASHSTHSYPGKCSHSQYSYAFRYRQRLLPFPSDYTIHYPFNDNDESYEFVMDQSLLWITEDRLDSPRIIVTESHQRQMVSRTQDLGSYVLCYEIEGAHEGEDLASSLILQDLADYVVSEVRSTEVFGLFEDILILLYQVYQKHESLSCVHIHADNPRSTRPIWSN